MRVFRVSAKLPETVLMNGAFKSCNTGVYLPSLHRESTDSGNKLPLFLGIWC